MREFCPFTMVIEDLGTLSALLSKAITASFASPSTGGAFVYTFKPSFVETTLDWELLGMTLRNKRLLLDLSQDPVAIALRRKVTRQQGNQSIPNSYRVPVAPQPIVAMSQPAIHVRVRRLLQFWLNQGWDLCIGLFQEPELGN